MDLLGIEKIGIIDGSIINLCEIKFIEKVNLKPKQKETPDVSINVSKRQIKENRKENQ